MDEWKTVTRATSAAEKSAALSATKVARKKLARGRSRELEDGLMRLGADMSWLPSRSLLDSDPVGREVLSIIAAGVTGRKPSQLADVVTILREIESGRAENLGFGATTLARGQRLGERLLEHARAQAGEQFLGVGFLNRGQRPSKWSTDTLEMVREMQKDGVVGYDGLGLRYGFAKLPEGQFQLEMEEYRRIQDEYGLPTLAEELFTRRFQPYRERLGTAQIRPVFNYIFRGREGATVYAQSHSEFIKRATAQGASAVEADIVWQSWSDHLRGTNLENIRTLEDGTVTTVAGEQTLMATPRNIPNGTLVGVAQRALKDRHEGVMPGAPQQDPLGQAVQPVDLVGDATTGPRSGAARPHPRVDVRQGGPEQLGQVRLLLLPLRADFRYHAMNFFEGGMLYAGRGALRPGELDQGLLGMTEARMRRIGDNVYADMGYTFGRDRFGYAERAFLKEQPDALRNGLSTMQAKDPELLRKAFEEMAARDPELSKTIAAFGDTPAAGLGRSPPRRSSSGRNRFGAAAPRWRRSPPPTIRRRRVGRPSRCSTAPDSTAPSLYRAGRGRSGWIQWCVSARRAHAVGADERYLTQANRHAPTCRRRLTPLERERPDDHDEDIVAVAWPIGERSSISWHQGLRSAAQLKTAGVVARARRYRGRSRR